MLWVLTSISFLLMQVRIPLLKYHPLIKMLSHYFSNFFTIFDERSLTKEEFKGEIFSLKSDKILGSENINVNVIKKIYDEVKVPLINIFNLSLSTEFPDKLTTVIILI